MTVWSYTSPDGDYWPLDGTRGVWIEFDSVDGLVGEVEEFPVRRVGATGEFSPEFHVLPMEGSFTVVGRDAEALKGFRGAWSRVKDGWLRLNLDGGVFDARVRLGSSPGAPAFRPRPGSRLEVNVKSDRGVWLEPYSSPANSVTVTNHGVGDVWVKIRWSGAGGVVELPSGAVFTLPPVPAPRTISLNPGDSNLVTDDQGNMDTVLWKQLRATVLPEPVLPGKSAIFKTPTNATLLWEVGILDPWGE